jgi:hypothetical protein
MQLSHAGVHERALATEFEYSVKMAGASRLAYPTMAGGGADTCTIHYSRNDKRVRGIPSPCARVCMKTIWETMFVLTSCMPGAEA